MFIRPGYFAVSALDRYASEAPMLTVPVAASEMPMPEPVLPVVIVTIGFLLESTNCFWYAVVQVPNSGNSNELPVSVSDSGLLAGDEGSAGPCMAAALADDELL